MNRREKGAVRSGVQLCTRTQNRRSFVPICLAFSFGGLSLNVPFGLWSVDRLFPQFNASQPSRPTVTGGTRFGNNLSTDQRPNGDRKSTRLNSSHTVISY